MTNEQLARAIQNGKTALFEQLLEQNRGIIHVIARRYSVLAARNGAVDMDDLTQAASLGMLEAIPAWDESRGGFLTLATLYMKKCIRDTLGIRSTKERIENMPTASLDAPITDESEAPLADLLQDENAVDPEEAAIQADMQCIVREAVASLPEAQRIAIQHRVYGGEAQGTMRDQRAAIRALGMNKTIQRLWAEYESALYQRRGLASWKNDNTSATEAAVIRRDAIRERMIFALNG